MFVDRSVSVPLPLGSLDLIRLSAFGILVSPPIELATDGALECDGRAECAECAEWVDAVESSSGDGSTDEIEDARLADLIETGEAILIVSSCPASSGLLSWVGSCSSSEWLPSGNGRCAARKVSLCLVETPFRLQFCKSTSRVLVRSHSLVKSQVRFLGVWPVGISSFVPFSKRV